MTAALTPPPDPAQALPAVVGHRLDQVLRRIRSLRLLAGCARLLTLAVLALVSLYAADRLLDLPVSVRLVVLVGAAIGFGREAWHRVLRPLLRGPGRLGAARLVESGLARFEGRLVSVLQLTPGRPGSLEQRVADEAAQACESLDLRAVLTSAPARSEVLRTLGATVALAFALVLVQPYTEVFFARWSLQDVAWPRDTHLQLDVPPSSPVHRLLDDGTLVASRRGVVSLGARWEGRRPDRVDIVVEGARGPRSHAMTLGSGGEYQGHVTFEQGDSALFVRGGDDDGDDSRRAVTVLDPPRLEDPRFVLEPPAYLGRDVQTVGPEGLVVPEGTRVGVRGRTDGHTTAAALWLAAREDPIPLELVPTAAGMEVSGTFVAEVSDSLSIVLTGAHDLATPDPSHHALLVREDRPPALRVYAPARSDVKITPRALVPVAVVAEDDHGIESVELETASGGRIALRPDGTRPAEHRIVLDVAALDLAGTVSYALQAKDGRDLPGRGPQRARVEGRRLDIVEESEVQRLLSERQLRLKEAFQSIADRQQRALEGTDDLLAAAAPRADDPDLLAAAVSQNQVTTRLARETRELCSIVSETITNRLDAGPGAEAVLKRHLEAWAERPVEEPFGPEAWRALTRDYAQGAFGRLDVVGRLLEMAAMSLALSEELSPAAHDLLAEARRRPDRAGLEQARAAQVEVRQMLERLLLRMDEWEDYQEVLTLVKTLIDDQESLRARTQAALGKGPAQN